MLLAYVAGSYRDNRGERYVLQNIDAAARVGRELATLGLFPVVPHQNTRMYGGNDIPDEFWLAGDLELMRRCDLVVMLPGWEKSEGARAEWREAMGRVGMGVYYWPEDRELLEKAVKEGAMTEQTEQQQDSFEVWLQGEQAIAEEAYAESHDEWWGGFRLGLRHAVLQYTLHYQATQPERERGRKAVAVFEEAVRMREAGNGIMGRCPDVCSLRDVCCKAGVTCGTIVGIGLCFGILPARRAGIVSEGE
jgi:hypothetical protein